MDHQHPPQQVLYCEVPGLEKMGLAWEEAQSAALNRQEWRRSVVQCIHVDAG